jgi:hypothetical protein
MWMVMGKKVSLTYHKEVLKELVARSVANREENSFRLAGIRTEISNLRPPE